MDEDKKIQDDWFLSDIPYEEYLEQDEETKRMDDLEEKISVGIIFMVFILALIHMAII